MKRLIAWFRRIARQSASQPRMRATAWDHSASMPETPEIVMPDVPDYCAEQQQARSYESFSQDTSWQPPACEAPSFDTSTTFSAPSACDPPSFTDP